MGVLPLDPCKAAAITPDIPLPLKPTNGVGDVLAPGTFTPNEFKAISTDVGAPTN